MIEKLISKDPATGLAIEEIDVTPVDQLPRVFAQARAAQIKWAALSTRQRAAHLISLREVVINHLDELIDLLSRENGKPRFEAMMNELLPSVELITYFANRGPKILRDKKIPMHLMKHRSSYLNYWPLGVVAVISPWNYPFLLPWGEIIMGLISGNAIVFKPSEVTPLIGMKMQEMCEQAGLPQHILQAVIGDGKLGAAIIQQKPAKVFFTGSVMTGKKIMAACSEHLIPLALELGGKDAMIVLGDADLDFATSAALWGGFSNSGQVCASVERILVHQSIAEPFVKMLKEKSSLLRQGASAAGNNDLGAMCFDRQALTYSAQISEARAKGADFIVGGDFSDEKHRYLKPTIVGGSGIENLDIYKEETFGPVIAITTFNSIDEAVQKANDSRYGLLSSIITRDISLGERVAKRIEVGTVIINEVTYTAGLPETPWGGLKDSGFGRKHSEMGLYEFVNVRHIHKPKFRFLTFKSLWWFPYTDFQYATFRALFGLYRRSYLDKIRAIPHLLWNFAQFIKREKRI